MINQLQTLYPNITFREGGTFMWSPSDQSIYYDPERIDKDHGIWSLLHEIGHAIANHQTFKTDLELIKLEVEAWSHAKKIASNFDIEIDDNHVQDCLDSYRDWLHARSRCPECAQINPQSEAKRYRCFNCKTEWKVSSSQLCSDKKRSAIA